MKNKWSKLTITRQNVSELKPKPIKQSSVISLFFLVSVFFFSCNNSNNDSSSGNSSSDNFNGKWKLCDNSGNYDCEIIKQGDVYDLRVKGKDFVLDKKTDELLSGAGGLITVRYDKPTQHLFLNDTGPLRELCKNQ